VNSRSLGRVIAVHAPVVDLRRAAAALPAVDEAIAIAAWNLDRPLVAEVQQHLDPTTVRAVALENAAGLKRGASAGPLGARIRVLVGEAVLRPFRALRMIARADRIKDRILDELYGLRNSGVNISVTQVQQIAVTIMRRANLPTRDESRKIEDRVRRVVEKKFPKPQNGMRDGFPPANRESAYRARWGRVVRI